MTTTTTAQSAYDEITTVLGEAFAYKSSAHLARHVAYLVTAANREELNSSPAFVFTGPQASGKTRAAQLGHDVANALVFPLTVGQDRNQELHLAKLLAGAAGRTVFVHAEDAPHLRSHIASGLVQALDGERDLRVLGGSNATHNQNLIVTATVVPEANLSAATRWVRIALVHREGVRVDIDGAALREAAQRIYEFGKANEPAGDVPESRTAGNWSASILGAMTHLRHVSGRSLAEVGFGR